MKKPFIFAAWLALSGICMAVPPIPEPGIIICGKVTNLSKNATVPITTLTWTITGNGKSVSLSIGAGVQLSTLNGETWFVVRAPFASSQVQGLTVDPVDANTFASTSSPVSYSHSFVEVNGVSARIVAPAGNSLTFPASANSLELGRTEDINLEVPHNLGAAYSTWAISRWGNIFAPTASPTADPDHDGVINAHEFIAGSEPTDAKSNLSAVSTSVNGGKFNFSWQSVAGKVYQIQSSETLGGQWISVGQPVTATQNTTSAALDIPQGAQRHFFRVQVVP